MSEVQVLVNLLGILQLDNLEVILTGIHLYFVSFETILLLHVGEMCISVFRASHLALQLPNAHFHRVRLSDKLSGQGRQTSDTASGARKGCQRCLNSPFMAELL